ncbi:MAG: DASS family sodium-coupled anion symporter [Pseudoclavibacter sp.]|nr:DASS family sodium-coupled anion symporter [Pseudoclavibacter sp.]
MTERQPEVPEHLDALRPDPARGREIDFQSPGERAPGIPRRTDMVRWGGVVAGLLLAVLVFAAMPADVPHNARLTAATAVLMAVWWMSEAIPIPATALVPLVVFPTLGAPLAQDGGEAKPITFSQVGASYGHSIVFLFLGGFLLALAMQRWNLHRRIALLVLRVMPSRPGAMIAGFMIATGFLSMWVSNTATAVMMLPIGMSVLSLVNQIVHDPERMPATGSIALDAKGEPVRSAADLVKTKFGTALMLGIAYAASIGSLGTIIGTPPNTFLAGYMAETHGRPIGFGQWMLVGVPIAVVFMVLAWLLLVKVVFRPEIDEIPGGKRLVDAELAKLGPVSRGELLVLGVFVLTAAAWIAVPLVFGDKPPIDDAGIAMTAGILLFLVPGGANRGVKLLDWRTAKELPWDVLLLFGGGLALSGMFEKSGLTEWIGGLVASTAGVPIVLVVALLAASIIFLTELTSNTATAATFIPVAGGVALGMGAEPMLLCAPVALAASCAFMLPVATPPNAVAYGSGYVSIAQMVRGGLWLNLIGIGLITLVSTTLLLWVFGLTL